MVLIRGILFNILGPLIVFLSIPFISKIHAGDYSTYVVFSSLASNIAVVATGRYELLLPIREFKDRSLITHKALNTLMFSTALTFLSCLTIGMVLSPTDFSGFYVALAISSLVFAQGIYQVGYYCLLAADKFTNLGFYRIFQALAMSAVQLLSSFMIALFAGEIFSRLIFLKAFNFRVSEIFSKQVRGAKFVRDYPFLISAMGGSFLSAVTVQFPLYLLTQYISVINRHDYVIFDRLVHIPGSLVFTLTGQYFYSKAARDTKSLVLARNLYLALSLFSSIVYLVSFIINQPNYSNYVAMFSGYLAEGTTIFLAQILLAREEIKLYITSESLKLSLLFAVYFISTLENSAYNFPSLYPISFFCVGFFLYLTIFHRRSKI